jgi:hypothetical protein
LVVSERLTRERFELGESPRLASNPSTSGHWWLLGDGVIGSLGPGSGGRQAWECYLHGRLLVIRHSLREAKSFFEDRWGAVSWQRIDLPKRKVNPAFEGVTGSDRPTRVWVADGLPED